MTERAWAWMLVAALVSGEAVAQPAGEGAPPAEGAPRRPEAPRRPPRRRRPPRPPRRRPAEAAAPAVAEGAPDSKPEGSLLDAAAAEAEAEAEAATKTPLDRAAGAVTPGEEGPEVVPVPPEFIEMAEEVERFDAAIDEFREDAGRLVQYRYDRKRREIKRRYGTVLDELTEEERQRRADAISRFEEFLGKYPNNPKYTPDALFRLAELHFEKSNDAYVTQLEEQEDLIREYDEGRLDELPPEPKQDYRRTIELFDQLVRQWPQYRNIDGAYYLKGYCLLEMGEDKRALDEFQTLVQRFPRSRFVPETWTRIGEYYFDYNRLPEAIAAYRSVLDFPESPYFDKALYKLAWTYYRNDQYDDAIARFRQLIEYSDERAAKTGQAGSDLRAEAIQYLAISLQEEDWDGDGLPDTDAGFQRVLSNVSGEKAYDVEILRAVADIFFDNAKYQEAIDTIRHLLATFPNHPENPELHARMVTAYERLQQFDRAFAERDNLAQSYGPDSAWYAANRNKPKALDAARELMEDALIQAATYHHSRAQQLRADAQKGDAAAEDEAIRSYRLAAVAYENYLKQFPKSENAYELNFFYAECLYYSFRFLEAANQYGVVRDSRLGDKYKEPAAFSAILAHEKSVRKLIADGRLPTKPSLTGADTSEFERTEVADEDNDGTVREIEPEPIQEPVVDLIGAMETYIGADLKGPEDKGRLPTIAYKTGEIYFDYKHFDEARKWFSWLIKKYPKEQVAGYAAGKIIETYRQAHDWENMAAWAAIIEEAGLEAGADDIARLKTGALFKKAEKLLDAERWDEAAAEFIRLVDENPGNRYADAALNNAAVAYEKSRRFESATNTYERLYRTYPDSVHAENALYRVGINAERFYDFEKAIGTLMQLVQQYPKSENRAEALFSAAVLQEQTQDYREAAQNYERYAQLFPEREDTPDTFYRAGRVYEKLGDTRNQIRIYETFIRQYGNDPKHNGLVVESIAKMAEIFDKQGRQRDAVRTWQRVIDEFNRRGMQPGTFEARYPAEAQFRLIELEFDQYKALKLRGSVKQQGKTIQEMQRRLKDLQRRYAEVIPYKSFDWTLAAFYRLGHIYQLFAEALYDAPIPESFTPEEEDVYRTTLEDIALPIEDEAVKSYEVAIEKAREFKVTNEWTKRIVQALNKYKPSDYPLFKEEKRLPAEMPMTPQRLVAIPEPPPPAEEITVDDEEGGAEDAPAPEEDSK
ncbi:MAG: tetratricopeptide repeat protein [Myxococcales bacterium]|nr:tetratricopeptide repeat protein [Myxococcales bacterium]